MIELSYNVLPIILLQYSDNGINIQKPNKPYNAGGAIMQPKYITHIIISIGILNIKNNYLNEV